MTAKEEAAELVDRFMTGVTETGYNYRSDEVKLYVLKQKEAKQCALICVNKILHELEEEEDGYRMDRVEYWEQVKQEIEKL